jgi:hypothetical protein
VELKCNKLLRRKHNNNKPLLREEPQVALRAEEHLEEADLEEEAHQAEEAEEEPRNPNSKPKRQPQQLNQEETDLSKEPCR